MQLCILQSGEINPAIADGLPGYQDMYSALFMAADPSIEITYFAVRDGLFPTDIDAFDAYVITGSPRGVYDDDDWIAPLHDLVRTLYAAGKPLIGICFGHQLIANALGGKAEKATQGWGAGIRTIPVTATGDHPLRPHPSFDLLYMHQDQVTALPDDAEILMGDDFCPIAAYRIGTQVLCFQGHPEFTHEVVAAIIDLREDNIGPARAAAGRDSLKRPHDGVQISRVITDFMAQAMLANTSSHTQ